MGPGGLDKEGKRVAPSVQPGDKVLIPQYGGSPVKVGEEEYALFRDYEYVLPFIIPSWWSNWDLRCIIGSLRRSTSKAVTPV